MTSPDRLAREPADHFVLTQVATAQATCHPQECKITKQQPGMLLASLPIMRRSQSASFYLGLIVLSFVSLLTATPVSADTGAKNEVVDFGINPAEASRLFNSATANWNASFKPSQLTQTLKGLAQGTLPITADVKKSLYTVRKNSSIVRASFQLLDQNHYKPKALNKYVTAAGKLNDALNAGQHDKVPELARKTLKAFNAGKIRNEVASFNPTTTASFNGYLFTSMLFAEKASIDKLVKAPVYHQLRKEMVNLLLLFESGRKLTPAMKTLYGRLQKLRGSMGDVHDKLVANKTKNPKSYDGKKVKLTKSVKRDLAAALKSIRVHRPSSPKSHYKLWRANIKSGRGARKAAPKKVR